MKAIRDTLLTDLYQLTMMQAYFDEDMHDIAVFEFFVRKLPDARSFLLTVGLQQVLDFLESLAFNELELEYLSGLGFKPKFLDYLRAMRFSADAYAMAEGTVFFPDEPILRVVAPIPVAQLVETRLINLLHFQTVIASKAIRCVLVAAGKTLVDFGARRAHGAEAALLAARATYAAGFSGTATVLAGAEFGIPVFGTMAHSYVQAHERESAAFKHFARSQPDNVTLLIDTYDTESAATKVVALAPELVASGVRLNAVRLDSGDLAAHARQVRRILDDARLTEVRIFCSGNLDEYRIEHLLEQGAPIDGFGVGTHVDTSSDAPFLDCAYKLQEYAGIPRRKRSQGKATWPGAKQVFRHFDDNGLPTHDTVCLEGASSTGVPLLEPVMLGGKRVTVPSTVHDVRQRIQDQLKLLAPELRTLNPSPTLYPVEIAPALRQLAEELDREPH